MTKLQEEEREKMIEKLEEAIKALDSLGNLVSEKASEIEKRTTLQSQSSNRVERKP